MTSASAGNPTLASLLQEVNGLQAAYSFQDFYSGLDKLIEELLGCKQISVVGIENESCTLLHSTRVATARDRLRPAELTLDAIADIVADAPAWNLHKAHAPRSIRMEGEDHPVFDAWSLGASGAKTAIVLFHEERAAADEEWIAQIAEEVRRSIAIAYCKQAERETLQEQVDLSQAKLHAINEVGELIGTRELDGLLTKLMQLSIYIVAGEIGSVLLVNKTGGIDNRVEWGFPLEMANSFVNGAGVVLYNHVIENREPVLATQFGPDREWRITGHGASASAYLCIPLVTEGKCVGVINLLSAERVEGGVFSNLDLEILMTISGLAATTIDNALLYEDSLEKQRYQQNLAIARDIQKRMYPAQAPHIDGLDIAWKTRPCDETGGDYFDFIESPETGLTAAIGDVSGHGIGSALIMASARAALRAILASGEALAPLFSRLNDQLEADMEMERFMTMFVATLGDGSSTIQYVNAGHDVPCIYRADKNMVEDLTSTGVPLGLFPGGSYRVGKAAALQPGDVLLLTTDGVWEVKNRDGVMLGKRQLMEIFKRHARLTAEGCIEAILSEVAAFTDGVPTPDDVTIVAIRKV